MWTAFVVCRPSSSLERHTIETTIPEVQVEGITYNIAFDKACEFYKEHGYSFMPDECVALVKLKDE